MNSTNTEIMKASIKTGLANVVPIAKEKGVWVNEWDTVGNNNITKTVEVECKRLLDKIKEASNHFDVVAYMSEIGYRSFVYGKAISVYVDENNFFYASRETISCSKY